MVILDYRQVSSVAAKFKCSEPKNKYKLWFITFSSLFCTNVILCKLASEYYAQITYLSFCLENVVEM